MSRPGLHWFCELTCPPKTGPGSELVLWQDLESKGGRDETEPFYCGADHQNAEGGVGSSVSGQERQACEPRAGYHGADLLSLEKRIWRYEGIPGKAFERA